MAAIFSLPSSSWHSELCLFRVLNANNSLFSHIRLNCDHTKIEGAIRKIELDKVYVGPSDIGTEPLNHTINTSLKNGTYNQCWLVNKFPITSFPLATQFKDYYRIAKASNKEWLLCMIDSWQMCLWEISCRFTYCCMKMDVRRIIKFGHLCCWINRAQFIKMFVLISIL